MPPRSDYARHIAQDEPLAIYLLVSVETTLLNEAVRNLRRRVLTAAPDFNRNEFRAGTPIAEVIQAARMMPMMAQKRWVALENVDKCKAAELAPLLDYLASPSPSTTLCLSATKVNGNTKWVKELIKQKAYFTLQPPSQRDLPQWLFKRAEDKGYGIDRDAAAYLADLIGSDVGALDMALEQLWTHANAQTISHADVDALIAPTRVRSIFELVDAIGRRDLGNASLLLRRAIDGGEAALRVLAMITRQFRSILQTKILKAGGASKPEIARSAKVAPFLVDSLLQQARRYDTHELYAALDAAARADIRIKSTSLSHGVILDHLLIEVMQVTGSLPK
ncbi:MAG: DNA polymerase III subunit delta [Myxococcota bacterium]